MQKTVDLPKLARLLDDLAAVVRENREGKGTDQETLEGLRFLVEVEIAPLKADLWDWICS